MTLPPDTDSGATDGVDVFAPRQETFLARYPRKVKLAATVALLALLIAPWFFFGDDDADTKKAKQTVVKADPAFRAAAPESIKPLPASRTAPPPAAPLTSAEEAAIIALNDANDRSVRMARAPDPGITEDSAEGSLPKIGEDGRKPWQIYARPFDNADKRPRVAIVMMNMGMSRVATDAVLQKLHANVTLAFDVQSQVVGSWMGRARQDGHELLLSLPMEPFDYPRSDPGPNALLTNLPNSDNLQRLLWGLRQGTGYVGVTTISGSRFMTNPKKMLPILEVLRQRGLMVFDTRIVPHSVIKDFAKNMAIPVAVNTQRLDEIYAPDAIDAALGQLEQSARVNGRAIGFALPTPVMIDRLENWIKQLPSHGVALAPLSAMVE